MHTDISCANIIVGHGAVTAAYDMDSIAWIDELRCLGSVAVHFTYTGGDASILPTTDEARAFIADYECARGLVFTARDHTRIDAAMIYAMAYTARCEGANPGAMSAALSRMERA